jgi:tetratricopeptide (TPR) repeat protein
MSPQVLLQRLTGQFTLYADGIRAVSTRQKSLHGAIAWSYDLLSNEEQQLFAYLSVFSGGFMLEAAESIFSRTITNKHISDLIASLLDKSLLQRTFDASGEPRFNMLVTIQQFALDCLQRKGEEAEVRNWHLAHFLNFAEQADKQIHGPDQAEWMDRVEKENDNYRALEWCLFTQKTEVALNLLGALGWAWFVRGYYSDTRNWFDKIRAMSDVADYPMAFGRTLNLLGLVGYSQGDYAGAHIFLEQALSIYQALGVAGESGMAVALDHLGMVVSEEGDLKGGKDLAEKAATLYAKCGDQRGYARALFHLGYDNQDTNLARSFFERSLAIFSQVGDVWGLGRIYHGLSWLFSDQRDYAKARPMAEQALANDQRIGFRAGIVNDLIDLGWVCRAQGDYDAATAFYEAGLDLSHQSGLKQDRAITLHDLGILALHRKNYGQAARYLTESLATYPSQYVDLSIAERLAAMAAVAGAANQPERAAKLYGAAQALHEGTDDRIHPFDLAEFNRHIQMAREQAHEQLGNVKFETLAADGRAMTMEQAIQLALS